MPAESTSSLLEMLNGLLADEQDSVFSFLAVSSPYATQRSAALGRLVAEMAEASQRNAGELTDLIQQLGGQPQTRSVHPDYQYLAYLSLEFLLSRLVEAQLRAAAQCQAALAAAGDRPEARLVLEVQRAEHQRYVDAITRLAEPPIAR